MFIVRNTFTAKPGMASKLAKLLKETMADMSGVKVRIMTDYIGPMNTVSMEMEVETIGDFERNFREYGERADIQAKMKDYTGMYSDGRREIYRVV